jgi:hypothetical protein
MQDGGLENGDPELVVLSLFSLLLEDENSLMIGYV